MKNTLFLDRDGIINVQIVGGYVRKPEEFVLVNGVLTAMQWLRPKFRHIIVVTNQQCVAKRICKMEAPRLNCLWRPQRQQATVFVAG